jgi:hypothetical protein
MTTGRFVGAATIATSLLWTLGGRVNSNLIEGISRNNDQYKKNLQFWITNPDMVEATSCAKKISNLIKGLDKYYTPATFNGTAILLTWDPTKNAFDIVPDKGVRNSPDALIYNTFNKERDSIRKILSIVSRLEEKLKLIAEQLDDTDTIKETKIEEALKFAREVKIQTLYILGNETWIEITNKLVDSTDLEGAKKAYYASSLSDITVLATYKTEAQKLIDGKKSNLNDFAQGIEQVRAAMLNDCKKNNQSKYIQSRCTIQGKTNYIKSQLSVYSAINYYRTDSRIGIMPYDNPANVTNSAFDFITTSANYYTRDSGAMITTQAKQLDCLAYGTQAVSGLATLKTNNTLYLLLNLVPLSILSLDITRNYINLGRGLKSPSV